MWLSALYLTVNVLALIVLWHSKYYRLAPLWCIAQALTCWQIAVRLTFGASDRTTAMVLWAPGEALLIIACVAAVCESFWYSLREWDQKASTYTGMIAGCTFLVATFADAPAGDWYAQFLAIRTYVYLGLALLAFLAFWVGLWANREWPRVDRMHAGLLAVLMGAHVILGDWGQWKSANAQWRVLECLVCVGFALNCRFLSVEIAELEKYRQAPSPVLIGVPRPHLPSDQSDVPAA